MHSRLKLSFVLALANTAVLLFLTTWFWSIPWMAGDEKVMIKATSAIKLGLRDIPLSEDYILINVSYDPILIDRYDEFGFPVGKQTITDREKLTRLFRIMNEQKVPYRYVLCDLFFEEASPYDSALKAEMQKLDRLILSFHLNEDYKPQLPVISGLRMGLSDYVIGNIFEGVYKFQLYFSDSLKLTPLVIAEDLSGTPSRLYGSFVKMGSWVTLNHFIMNYRLLQKDIDDQEVGFNPVHLGELLSFPDDDIPAYLQDKFIVIGDFYEQDMHETIFEITSGPVVLLNAFWSLENKDTKVNVFFILILLGSYFFVSYLAVHPEDLIEKHIRKRYGKIRWVGNLTSFMSYLLILIVVSVFTYFLFNIHINTFFLAIYLFVIEKVSNFLIKRSPSR